MTLDIVEEHLNRGHLEVVGSKEEYRQLECLDLVHGGKASMIVGIINHDHSRLPPLGILGVEVGSELCEEESEGVAIGLPNVHSIEDFSVTSERSYQVHPDQSTVGSHHVLLLL